MRPILHRASLVEMCVPYGDPNPPYERKCAFDVGGRSHHYSLTAPRRISTSECRTWNCTSKQLGCQSQDSAVPTESPSEHGSGGIHGGAWSALTQCFTHVLRCGQCNNMSPGHVTYPMRIIATARKSDCGSSIVSCLNSELCVAQRPDALCQVCTCAFC